MADFIIGTNGAPPDPRWSTVCSTAVTSVCLSAPSEHPVRFSLQFKAIAYLPASSDGASAMDYEVRGRWMSFWRTTHTNSPCGLTSGRWRHRGNPGGRWPSSSIRTARGLNARRAGDAYERRAPAGHYPAAATRRQPSNANRGLDRSDALTPSTLLFEHEQGRPWRQVCVLGRAQRITARAVNHAVKCDEGTTQIDFLTGTGQNSREPDILVDAEHLGVPT